MDITDLQYEAKGPVAWIRFNRPARRNALGNMSTRHLVQLCRQADQAAAVKAVMPSALVAISRTPSSAAQPCPSSSGAIASAKGRMCWRN